jgi:AH receptor-interacting protein
MELILGKEFKLQIWEELLKSMCVEEVSQFVIDKRLVMNYPHVSKIFRKFANHPIKCKLPDSGSSCCGAMMKSGLGYDDLDQLLAEPHDLRFTFEVISVQQTDEYNKELWQMDDVELQTKIVEFKEEGTIVLFTVLVLFI